MMSWLKKFSAPALLIVAWLLTQQWPAWGHLTDAVWLQHYAQSATLFTYLGSSAAMVVLLSVGLPRQIVGFVCGLWLGTVFGTLLATLLSTAACLVTFSLARFWIGDWVASRYANRFRRWQHWLTADTFFKILMLRLLPVGSNLLTNLLAGSLRLPVLSFTMASALGYIPQTLIFALAGQGIALSSQVHMITSLVLLAVSSVVGVLLARRRQQLPESVSNA